MTNILFNIVDCANGTYYSRTYLSPLNYPLNYSSSIVVGDSTTFVLDEQHPTKVISLVPNAYEVRHIGWENSFATQYYIIVPETNGVGIVNAKDIITSSVPSASYITMSFATSASFAFTSVSASYAQVSDYASTAGTSNEANHASMADYATQAGNAYHADDASNAVNAQEAQHAVNADMAISASYSNSSSFAQNAAYSDYAGTATQADFAADASHASSADTAINATNAGYADNAGHATTADSATNSDNATSASHANTADTSISASYASHTQLEDVGGTINGNLTLSGSLNSASYIDFLNDGTPTQREGRVYYDPTAHTLCVYNDQTQASLNVGEENWVRVVNKTGVQINDGQVCTISGSQGNRPKVKLAQSISGSQSTYGVIGIATVDIPINAEGVITSFGVVHGVDTSNWNTGDILYVSSSAGQLTNVLPVSPWEVIKVGVALNSTNNGSIFVSAQDYMSIHDIQGLLSQNPTQGDLLVYDTASLSYKNTKTLTANITGTISNATSASYAQNANHAASADYATEANHATTADSATTADTANQAVNANNADYAVNAGFASSADNANTATSASHALNSDNSITASYVNPNNVGLIPSASHANNSDNSISASYATNALNLVGGVCSASAVEVTSGNINVPTSSATMGVYKVNGTTMLQFYNPTPLTASNANVFCGPGVGNFTTTGTSNVGIGRAVMGKLATVSGGVSNIGLGYNCLFELLTGTGNVGIGQSALQSNQSSDYNFALGYNSLVALQSGTGRNIGVGVNSLAKLTTGTGNVAIGNNSGGGGGDSGGVNLTSGVNNTCIGNSAGYTDFFISPGNSQNNGSLNVSQSTCIGVGAQMRDNGVLILGGSGSFAVNGSIGGNFAPTHRFEVAGDIQTWGFGASIVTKTSNYSLTKNDYTVLFSGSNLIATLPNVTGSSSRIFNIKNIHNTSLTVTSSAATNLIDNQSSWTVPQYSNISVHCDGAKYWII